MDHGGGLNGRAKKQISEYVLRQEDLLICSSAYNENKSRFLFFFFLNSKGVVPSSCKATSFVGGGDISWVLDTPRTGLKSGDM